MVETAVAAVVDGAPEAFDTLKEISDWISSDETGTAVLIEKVNKNAEDIEELSKLKAYVDEQDTEIINSISNISNEKINALFRTKVEVEEGQTYAEAITALTSDSILVLPEDAVVEENIEVPAGAYIDANGATFSGEVSVAKDAIIENAVFTGDVTIKEV